MKSSIIFVLCNAQHKLYRFYYKTLWLINGNDVGINRRKMWNNYHIKLKKEFKYDRESNILMVNLYRRHKIHSTLKM